MKKTIKIILSILLSFSLVGCQTKPNQQGDFDTFMQQVLVEYLDDNYVSITSYFEHPENFGIDIDNIEVSFGDVMISDQEVEEQLKEYQEKEKELKKFDKASLSSSQQNAYDIYLANLENAIRSMDKDLSTLGTVFNSGNGLHTNITTILPNLPVREEKDIENLILLTKDVKRVFKEAIEYTNIQAEKGMLMVDIEGVVGYCEKIVSKGQDSSILKDMIKNLDGVQLEESKKQTYIEELSIAFNDVLEGYQYVIDGLNALRDSPNNSQGFYHLENGKEYYETLVKGLVGEDISIKEIKADMTNMIMTHLNKGSKLYEDNVEKLTTFFNEGFTTSYMDYYTMLEDLEKNMLKDFPTVSKMDYTIVDLDPEVTSSLVGAYFITPSYDNTQPMNMYVNSTAGFDINDLTTFTTVAHEGIPGHMYQYTYARENIEYPYLYIQNSNLSYTEGYAEYVELLSYEHIEGLDPELVSYIQSNDMLNAGMIILADIGIHYEGWTIEDFEKFFAQFGVEWNSEDYMNQYKQLQSNPGTFISYYYGCYQFEKMKEKAKSELGDKFTELGFHEAILKSGNAPFNIVEKNVEAYIEEIK